MANLPYFAIMYNLSMNLSELTTLHIGGPAKEVIIVKTEEELIQATKPLTLDARRFLIIGSGSNLLVSDEGYDGIIIKNEIKGIEKKENTLVVKSGTILQDLVDFANNNGLQGLQTLAGIPGTVGGAVYGNAGAYGQTISDHLVSVKSLTAQNSLTSLDRHKSRRATLTKQDYDFSYRDSIFKRNKSIILEATFELTPGNPDTLKSESEETIKKREVKYPPGIKCPGSFFKNIPANTLPAEIIQKVPKQAILFGKVSSGALLESIGAKGAFLGQIKIAPYHANLFINEGGGTAKDFYELAKEYSQKVYDKYGIKLEPEVQLINLPPLN